MSPPTIRPSASKVSVAPPIEIDPGSFTLLDPFFENFLDDFLPGLRETEASPQKIDSFVTKLFHNTDATVRARFQEADLPIPGMPDFLSLRLEEGACLCFGAHVYGGNVALDPIQMCAMNARVFGIPVQPITGIKKDDDGEVRVHIPLFDKGVVDLNEKIFASPAGELFPDKKIIRPSLQSVLDLLRKMGTAESGGGTPQDPEVKAFAEGFMKALKKLCIDGATMMGGFHLNLDVPKLRANIKAGQYMNLDFTGVEWGTHWYERKFNLKDLPPIKGIDMHKGSVDVSVRYLPEVKETQIYLKNLDLEVAVPNLLGDKPIRIQGDLSLLLRENWDLVAHFDEVRVQIPSFPSPQQNLIKHLSFSLNGDVAIQPDPETSHAMFQESRLSINNIILESNPEQRVRFLDEDYVATSQILGDVDIHYIPCPEDTSYCDPMRPIHLEWNLWGNSAIDAIDNDSVGVSFDRFRLNGQGTWTDLNNGLRPNLADLSVQASTDIRAPDPNDPLLSVKQLWINVIGIQNPVTDRTSVQEAGVQVGAEAMQAGVFKIHPYLGLILKTTHADDRFQMSGQGAGSLDAENPRLAIASAIKFLAGEDGVDYRLGFDIPQLAGPLMATGEMSVEGRNGNFRFTTHQPYQVTVDDKTLVRNLVISGPRHSIRVKGRVMDLADAVISLHVSRQLNFSGDYEITPLDGAIPELDGLLSITDAKAQGTFRTSRLPVFLERPATYLSGEVSAALHGRTEGELKITHHGPIVYVPRKDERSSNFHYHFDKKRQSSIQVGPVDLGGPLGRVAARGDLEGTFIVITTTRGAYPAGRGFGVRNGELTSDRFDQPIFSNTYVIADRWFGRRPNVAHGFKMESDNNLDALLQVTGLGTYAGEWRPHTLIVTDHIPLTEDGHLKLYKQALRQGLLPNGGTN